MAWSTSRAAVRLSRCRTTAAKPTPSSGTAPTAAGGRERVRGKGAAGHDRAGGLDGGFGSGAGGEAGDDGACLSDSAELQAAALSLARRIGSEEQLRAVMELLADAPSLREVVQELHRRGLEPDAAESLLGELRRGDFVRDREGALRLTDRGWRLADYIARHRRDLRLALRKAMRRTVQKDAAAVGRGLTRGRYDPLGRARSRRAGPPEPGVPLQDVAWPESVTAAAARQAAARRRPAGGRAAAGDGAPARLRLDYEDLRVLRRRRRRPVDVCLLIDASASMAGERMRAAKTLARHLLATTRDRVAVIVFQERQVRVSVPFTRNDLRVEQGLATIRPYGLTPLATGLAAAREYLRSARPRNPLLLLITDGIPTVPHDGTNPLDDALAQAQRWRGNRRVVHLRGPAAQRTLPAGVGGVGRRQPAHRRRAGSRHPGRHRHRRAQPPGPAAPRLNAALYDRGRQAPAVPARRGAGLRAHLSPAPASRPPHPGAAREAHYRKHRSTARKKCKRWLPLPEVSAGEPQPAAGPVVYPDDRHLRGPKRSRWRSGFSAGAG